MSDGAAHNRVDPRFLGDCPTLGRCHLSAVTRKELLERRFLGSARISDPARPVSFRLKIAGPTFRCSLGIKRLGARRHPSTTHLRLPAPSEFADCSHDVVRGSLWFCRVKDAGDSVPRTIPARCWEIRLCRYCAYSEPHTDREVEN